MSSKTQLSASYLSFAMRVLLLQNQRYPNGHRDGRMGFLTTEQGASLISYGGESGLSDQYALFYYGQKKHN